MTTLPVNTRPKIRLVRESRPKIRMTPVAGRSTRLAVLPGAVAAQRSANRANAAAAAAQASEEALELALSAQFVVRTIPSTLPAARALGDTPTVAWEWDAGSAVTASVPDGAITYAKIQHVAADSLLGSIGGGVAEEIRLTAAGRALLDDPSAMAQRATLGLDQVDNTSDADKPVSAAQAAADNLRQLLSEKGQANGYAPLDGGTKVPAIYLPSYVDDTLEYASTGAFPIAGEVGKIYVALDTNNVYRWSGSTYVEIAASPGSTDEVAEGAANLYFTAARVRSTVLTGLVTVAAAAVSAADTVIGALQKLQAQISDHAATIAAHTTSIDLKANSASPVFTGTVENHGAEVYSGDITPAVLVANTDNYNPPGLVAAARIRLSASSTVNLTGIVAGADGRRLVLHNVGTNAILLKDDVTSAAANRFALNADIALSQDQSIQIEYDGTTQRWRAIGGIGGGASGGGLADGDYGDVIVGGAGTTLMLDIPAKPIGYGQIWQNVLASRMTGSSYQNNTGRPIMVSIQGVQSSGTIQVSSNNSTWVTIHEGVSSQHAAMAKFIVPSGWYYRLTGSNPASIWAELR